MTNDRKIAVVGGGKIGELVIALLSDRYAVTVYDQDEERARKNGQNAAGWGVLDVNDEQALDQALEGHELVINCCPHFCNIAIATAARKADISYCDLSEDVASRRKILSLCENASGYFVPCCGLAPGFIQIVANHIIGSFDSVYKAKMRVGALPENPTNALKYNLTWSTDGLNQ